MDFQKIYKSPNRFRTRLFEIASSNMNEICIFTFSSRSNRINSRVLLSRNVAEFHFCVQHAGHATKFVSYRTKNWTIYRHIWHLEPKTNRIGSSVQPSVRAHFETENRTEPRLGSVRFGSVRTDFRFGSI